MPQAAPAVPHVLLLPGMTLNDSIFPDLPYPTVSVDFNDAPPPPDASRPMTRYVRELDHRLATRDEWRAAPRRLVVAHSFGGMLALEWILAQSPMAALTDGLVLLATTAGPMYDMVKIRLARFGDRDFRVGVTQLMSLWNQPLVTRTMKRAMTGGRLAVERVDFREIENPTDLNVDFAGWRNTDWRAMRSYRSAMRNYDVRHRLGQVSVPTIVLHGSDDALFATEAGQALAAGIPDAEFRMVKGARHALPLTHGADVVRAVRDIAKRVDR